jgi:hypothetical protein
VTSLLTEAAGTTLPTQTIRRALPEHDRDFENFASSAAEVYDPPARFLASAE